MQSFTAEDLLEQCALSDLSAHPKRDAVAFVVKGVADGSYQSSIWECSSGGTLRQLTSGSAADNSPRWSPTGDRLAFVSARLDGPLRIHILPSDGGESRALPPLPGTVSTFEWSPDGSSLLALAVVPVDSRQRGARPKGDDAPGDDAPEVAWRLPYKSDGLGFTLNRELHAFVVDVETGEATQLTDGAFDVRSAGWSPDGRSIAFVRTVAGRLAHRTELWLMSASGDGARAIVTELGTVQYPKWSPDGRYIAVSGTAEEGDAQTRLWLYDVERHGLEPLGSDSIEVVDGDSIEWSQESKSLRALVASRGRQHIADISVPDGEVTPVVTGDRHVTAMASTAGHVFFASATPCDACEIAVARRDGSDERSLTHFNDWWRDRTPLEAEVRTFSVPDGNGGTERIEGWLVRAKGAKRGPLLVDVHGGPESYVLLAAKSHPYWGPLCSQGWSILALNAVGSASYGRKFATRLRNHWGELDLPQHLAAVEQLQRDGVADDGVAIVGKSYGGYLAAWAVGQTKQFRAAVVMAPVTNLASHYATSDSGYYTDPYSFAGAPKLDRGKTVELSPFTHADKARTPTLILCGKEDQRCPMGQAEELFVTLSCTDDPPPTELVLYPGGDHHLLEDGPPNTRVEFVGRILEWLTRWQQPAAQQHIQCGAKKMADQKRDQQRRNQQDEQKRKEQQQNQRDERGEKQDQRDED